MPDGEVWIVGSEVNLSLVHHCRFIQSTNVDIKTYYSLAYTYGFMYT